MQSRVKMLVLTCNKWTLKIFFGPAFLDSVYLYFQMLIDQCVCTFAEVCAIVLSGNV